MSDINHPLHYKAANGLEAIDVIDAFFDDNYNLGNVFKYIARCDKKHDTPLEDLRKALWYLEHELELAEQREADWEEWVTLTPKGKVVAHLVSLGIGVPNGEIIYVCNTEKYRYEYVLTGAGKWQSLVDGHELDGLSPSIPAMLEGDEFTLVGGF